MRVEIFSFLLSLVPVPERQGNWFLLGTLSMYLASTMSTSFSKDCHVVCALLGEETIVMSLMSLFSPSERLSRTPTPPPQSHGRMCTMTWGHLFCGLF